MRHPLQFVAATASIKSNVPPVLITPVCREIYERFASNIQIALGAAYMPGFSFWIAMNYLSSTEKAKRQILNFNDFYTPKELEVALPQIGPRAIYLTERALNMSRDKQIENMKELTHMFEMFAIQVPYITDVMEGMLKGIFIQTWTAFEVLCDDVGVMCPEKHPSIFPEAKMKGFYVKRRKDLIDSFGRAFDDDPAIMALVRDKFITAVAAFRHCLIHKSGIIDKGFRKDAADTQGFLDHYLQQDDGTRIRFNGPMILQVIVPAIAQGYALLEAVDQWIIQRIPPTI